MGRRRKLGADEIANSFPFLNKLSKCRGRRGVESLMKKGSDKDKDVACRCIEISLRNLKDSDFSDSQLKKLFAVEERLNFLSSYAKCSGARKKCLVHERDNSLIQGGQGIGLLLSTILPLIAKAIIEKVGMK